MFKKYVVSDRFLTGLTLIEILLVVGILAILVTLVFPLTLDFYKSQQLDSCSQGIIQTLRRAQLKAMSSENDSNFGVYLTNDSYVLFKGDSYENRHVQYDEVFDLPQILTVSGVQEVVFLKFEGTPIGGLTGDIILNSNGKHRVININEIGRISLEL